MEFHGKLQDTTLKVGLERRTAPTSKSGNWKLSMNFHFAASNGISWKTSRHDFKGWFRTPLVKLL
jgi:IS4 transposase